MLTSIRTFLQESIGIAQEKLHSKRMLFLLASGDMDLDWLIEFSILSGLKKGKPSIFQNWSDEVRDTLKQRENLTILKNCPAWMEQLSADDLASFIRELTTASAWTSPVLFDMGVNPEAAIQALRKISSANAQLNLGIQVNPSLPQELSYPVLIEFLRQQQIEPDDLLKERLANDVKDVSLSYTHIRIFTQQCERMLRAKAGAEQPPFLMSPADYDEVGTVHYFIEFSGKSFLTQAESLIDIQSIEWIFRSLLLIRNGEPFSMALTIDEIADRTGLSVEKIAPVLNLGADFGFDLLRLSGGQYSIMHQAVFQEWSDMKTWVDHETEAIQLLVKYRQLALQHAHGNGHLLNGVQLEEVNRWKQQNSIQPAWAASYIPDIELVIGYISASEQSFREQQDAQEKARTRRLKFAYQLAGGSVVIGVLILMLSMWAWGQKKQAETQKAIAELEKKRSDTAYRQAEKNRLVAVQMQREADISAQEALKQATIARIAETDARNQQKTAEAAKNMALESLRAEEKAKIQELEAKRDAIRQRERAEGNEKKARNAEIEATNNASRADRLRMQQESRANALAVYEDFDNAQFEAGRSKASHAYEQFVRNGGSRFDRDILTVLMEGAFRHKPSVYMTPVRFQPLRMAEHAPQQQLALYGMDKKVRIFDMNNRSLNSGILITETLRGLGFVDDRSLLAATPSSLLRQLSDPKTASLPAILTGKDIRQFFTFPGKQMNVWVATIDAVYAFQYSASVFRLVDSFAVREMTNLRHTGDYWVCTSGNQLLRLDASQRKWKKVCAPGNKLTAISGIIRKNEIAAGDEAGNLYVVNILTGEVIAERAKLHMSRISGLESVPFNTETDILVSAGYDHYVHIFYVETDRLAAAGLPSPVSLREHKRWITGLSIDPKQLRAITCSVDEQIRYWPLNPEDFLYKGNVSISPTYKKK